MTQQFEKSGPFVFKSSCPFSRGVPKRKKRKHSIHYDADPNSAQILMETIMSVNPHSLYKVVLFKYFVKKIGRDNVSPNTNLNLAPEIVTTCVWWLVVVFGGWCVCVCVWWLVCLCGGWCVCVVVGVCVLCVWWLVCVVVAVLLLSSRETVCHARRIREQCTNFYTQALARSTMIDDVPSASSPEKTSVTVSFFLHVAIAPGQNTLHLAAAAI